MQKAKFIAINADNDVNARRAWSRHNGNDVDDICVDLPACDLWDLIISY